MSRVHQLGHLRLLHLIAIYHTLIDPNHEGQGSRHGYGANGWTREQVIDAIIRNEQPPKGHQP